VGGNESIFNVLCILSDIHCKIYPHLSKRFAVSRDFCSSRGLCFISCVGAAAFLPSCATQRTQSVSAGKSSRGSLVKCLTFVRF